MHLDLLQYFFEAVRKGSIRGASESFGVAPSSISRTIAELERRIGTKLIERSATGIEPTHAGKIVAEYARKVILDYESLRADLNDARGTSGVLVRLGVVEGMIWEGAVAPIVALREKFDGAHFRVSVLPPSEIGAALKRGEIDVGVSFCQSDDIEIKTVLRIPDPIRLIVPTGHEFEGGTSLTMRDISGLPVGLLAEKGGLRELVDHAALAENINLRPAIETNSMTVLRAFVLSQGGVSFLTERTVEMDILRGTLSATVVHSEALEMSTLDVVVLRNRRLSRILTRFVEQLAAGLPRRGNLPAHYS